MSIRCGTCKGSHESIADVRACSEHYAPDRPVSAAQNANPVADDRPLATEKQIDFCLSLFARKVMPEGKEPLPRDVLETLPRRGDGSIGNIIDAMMKQPDRPGASLKPTDLPDVPAGRYAIEVDGTLKFYVVDRPTEGRWAGYTFLKVQASDETHDIRNASVRKAILTNIARDPQGAMLRYGKEIGKCGHCGRTLTNEESRAAGIGPICAGKMGWAA